jgi:signal transduction histidine kinase
VRRPLDLPDAVRQVVAFHEGAIVAKGLRAHLRLPDSLPGFSADGARIRQLLHLLVRHALDAAPERGSFSLAVIPSDHAVLLELAHDGPKLASPEAVFRPFFSPGRGGSGLAMAIARDIVRAHGGEVNAAGGQEGGLKIAVRLPLVPA